jgi:glycosyltransferase involved in cell wall biosynthesis
VQIAVYHNLSSGGAKRTLWEAVRRLAQTHTVDVYTLACADHDFADLRPFARQHIVFPFAPLPLLKSPWGRLNQASRMADLMRLDRVTQQIARQIERQRYDVVLVEPCQVENASSLIAHLQGVRVVYFCQESLRRLYEPMPYRPYDAGKSRLRRGLDRLDPLPGAYLGLLKRRDRKHTRQADVVLANSRFSQAAIGQNYQVDARVSYHGVDTAWFCPQPGERSNFVLSVGSLTPLKGFDFLIEALAQIPPARRPPLVIASNFQNPPERDYLHQMAAERQVDLTLLGQVGEAQLVRLYNEARLTLYAPLREPLGLVALESMACGTAVVGVCEGGIVETVRDGQTGLLVERDPARFAHAVEQLLDAPQRAQSYGRNGREHVLNQWSWDHAIAGLEHHLQS